VVSLLCYFVCLITIGPPRTVATEAAWDGVHGGAGGWRGVVVTSLHDGWYGYPIRLTRIHGYASNYCNGYEYPYAYSHNVQFYVAVHGVRRVRDYRCRRRHIWGGQDPRATLSHENRAASLRRYSIA